VLTALFNNLINSRRMKQLIKLGIVVLLISFLQSCYYDNEEELYPQVVPCDTSNVTYSGEVAIVMLDNCNSCHGGAFPQGGIVTDNYSDLKVIAENGKLWGAVNHEDGYSAMPQNRPKLNDCDLSIIRIWIDNGALDD